MTMTKERLGEIKARCDAWPASRQTDESLKALTNDIGLIFNPSLGIAASVASECLKARQDIPDLLAELERKDKEIEKLHSLLDHNAEARAMEVLDD